MSGNGQWDGIPLVALLKKYQYALLVVLLGVVLLLFPSGEASSHEEQVITDSVDSEIAFDLERQEQRLSQVLSQIKGVGRAEVLLTLAVGSERILAEDNEQSESGSKSTTIVIRGGSGEEATITTQITAPIYQGALIVCEGGENPSVRLAVRKAVQALTGLSANHISICAASATGGSE